MGIFGACWFKFAATLFQLDLMAERREHVKTLRALARSYEVEQVRDAASREKVLQMVASLRAKQSEQSDRRQVDDATAQRDLQTSTQWKSSGHGYGRG